MMTSRHSHAHGEPREGDPPHGHDADSPGDAHSHGHGSSHNHDCDHERGHGHNHGHNHNHNHNHNHGHGHHHHHHVPAGALGGRVFAIAIALNLGFVVIEVAAGFYAGSMALLADAGHNFADGLALALAWGASILARRPPSARFTYGLKSSSILAALANAALLWVAQGAILIATLQHLLRPTPVAGGMVIAVAAAGVAVNGGAALLFAKGSAGDINLRAAFAHLLADAAVSAGVMVAGALVLLTGWVWLDPVTSLAITAIIALGSWRLLREAVSLGLHGVPPGIDEAAVRGCLAGQPGVSAVHDLHIWPMSTTDIALTAHLVIPGGHPGDAYLYRLTEEIARRFGIGHATLQIELEGSDCALHPEGVV